MREILTPFVSVIVPVFNEERLIAQCLASLLEQDYPKECMEIIAVDNGSTDGSREIIRKFPIQYILEEKRGAAAARNTGAHQARGELLAFIDADCAAPPEWISKLVASLGDSSCDAAGGDCRVVSGKSIIQDYLAYRGFYSQKEFFSPDYPLLPWLMTGNLMVRRDAFFKVGGFEETLLRGEDIDFSWLLVLNGSSLKYLPDLEVLHERHPTFLNLYRKLFKDGKATVLLERRYGSLCHKNETEEKRNSLFGRLGGVFTKLKNRTAQILIRKNGLSFLRRIVYLFLASTGHLIFLSGKKLNLIRYDILQEPIPVPILSRSIDRSKKVPKVGVDLLPSLNYESLRSR